MGKPAGWGYRLDNDREAGTTAVTVLLTRAAPADGSRRISPRPAARAIGASARFCPTRLATRRG
ncbi:hypothetical protein GCM10010388_66020 [Streptomyces mauvecolor]